MPGYLDPGRGPSAAIRMHGCPVPRCAAWLPASAFICRADRRLVPAPLWAELWRTWDGGRGAATTDHQGACRAAIEAAVREGTCATESTRISTVS